MVNNTLLRSAGAQLGELRASLDGLRRDGAAAGPATGSAAATPIGADLLRQAMAVLPSVIEYAGLARQLFGSCTSTDTRVEVQRSASPGVARPGVARLGVTRPSLGRRLRRTFRIGLALGGCYLAYRVMRPVRQQGMPQHGRARA